MTRVAVLRCARLPSFVTWEVPNLEELFEEDQLLIEGLKARGMEAHSVVWSDPNIDWDRFDMALIRSTWDYLDEKERFLQTLRRIETSSCRLFNPSAAVHWNIDKHYLFELEEWGLPIIPTYAAADFKDGALRKQLAGLGIETLVIKPAVGLGSSHSSRSPLEEIERALKVLGAAQPQRSYLVQPFIQGILEEGEWSFIFFNGQFSHALLKKPAPNDYRVQGIYGGTVQPAGPDEEDLAQAQAVMAGLPYDVLYARLDFVRLGGRLAIMEIELIEPILGFGLVPQAIPRLVNALKSRQDTGQ